MIHNVNYSKAVPGIVFLLGSIGIVAIMALDLWYWRTGLIAEGWPEYSAGYIARSVSIFIFILAIFWSLISDRTPELESKDNSRATFERFCILGSLSVSIIILLVFIIEPQTFSALSLEGGLVEWGSFALLSCSAIIVFFTFLKYRNVLNLPKFTKLSLALLAFVFFVIAMEEVSWFQRELGINTPELFGINHQGELNLHNFSTDRAENIYYFGTFIFLVVLPFIRYFHPFVSNSKYLRIFVARPYIAIIGSIACAYNFDMWNIIFTQMYFFGSVIILFLLSMFCRNTNDRYIILSTLFVVVFTQVVFLVNGENYSRLWEVTEYKELFIPLAFFIYSLDVFAYFNRAPRPEPTDKHIHSDGKTFIL